MARMARIGANLKKDLLVGQWEEFLTTDGHGWTRMNTDKKVAISGGEMTMLCGG